MILPARRLLCLGLLLGSPVFAAQSVAPVPLPAERYEKLLENSPFSVKTVAPEVPVGENGPGPFDNLYVMAVAKLGDAGGKEVNWVTIKSRADQSVFSLVGDKVSKEGIAIASVEWSERLGKSKVTLKKDGVFKEMEFDLANFQAGAPPANGGPRPPAGAPPIGGHTRVPIQGNFPAPNNNVPPRNRMQQPIPRPSSAPQMTNPMPGVSQASPTAPGANPVPNRRRVRIITDKP